MKELSPLQTTVYRIGGVLILAGAVLWPLSWKVAVAILFIGAVAFGSMQMLNRYDGKSVTVKRLRRQQFFGAVLLLLTPVFMFVGKLHLGYLHHNEWMVCLAIAAIFECYTAFRIPYELKKENS